MIVIVVVGAVVVIIVSIWTANTTEMISPILVITTTRETH